MLAGRFLSSEPRFLARPAIARGASQAPGYDYTPEEEESLLSKITDVGIGGLSMVGHVLTAPSRFVWGEEELSGALSKIGLLPKNKPGFDWLDPLRFVIDIIGDPLTYLTLGASALAKTGKALKAAGVLEGVDLAKVARATSGANVGPRVARLTVTPRKIASYLSTEQARKRLGEEATETAAARLQETMSKFADSAMDEPIGGLVGTMGPMRLLHGALGGGARTGALGTGPVAQTIAGAMDRIGASLRRSRPGMYLSALFSSKAGNQYLAGKPEATRVAQDIAEEVWQRQRHAVPKATLPVHQISQELRELAAAHQEFFGKELRESAGTPIAETGLHIGDVARRGRNPASLVLGPSPSGGVRIWELDPPTHRGIVRTVPAEALTREAAHSTSKAAAMAAMRTASALDDVMQHFRETDDLASAFAKAGMPNAPPEIMEKMRALADTIRASRDTLQASLLKMGKRIGTLDMPDARQFARLIPAEQVEQLARNKDMVKSSIQLSRRMERADKIAKQLDSAKDELAKQALTEALQKELDQAKAALAHFSGNLKSATGREWKDNEALGFAEYLTQRVAGPGVWHTPRYVSPTISPVVSSFVGRRTAIGHLPWEMVERLARDTKAHGLARTYMDANAAARQVKMALKETEDAAQKKELRKIRRGHLRQAKLAMTELRKHMRAQYGRGTMRSRVFEPPMAEPRLAQVAGEGQEQAAKQVAEEGREQAAKQAGEGAKKKKKDAPAGPKLRHERAMIEWLADQAGDPLVRMGTAEADLKYISNLTRKSLTLDAIYDTLGTYVTNQVPARGTIRVGKLLRAKELGLNPSKALEHLASRLQMNPVVLSQRRVPRYVADAIRSISRLSTDETIMSPFGRWWHNVVHMIKRHFTLPFPSFAGRNFLSGQLMNVVSGIVRDGKDMADYGRAFREVAGEMGKLARGEPSDIGLDLNRLRALGLHTPHIGFEDIRHSAGGPQAIASLSPAEWARQGRDAASLWSLGPRSRLSTAPGRAIGEAYKTWEGTGSALNQSVEFLNRVVPYHYLTKYKGWSPDAAAQKVKYIQIDYADATKFERTWMRGLFPFYMFNARMLSQTAKSLVEQPGGPVAQIVKAISRQSDPSGPIPEHVRETASIPIGEAEYGKKYMTGFGLPWEQPLALFTGPRSLGQEIASLTAPPLKGAFEWITGRSLYQRGRELEDLDPVLGRIIANVTGAEEPPRLSTALETILANSPYSRFFSTARQITDPRRSFLEKLAHQTTGLRTSIVTPETQDALIRERVGELMRASGARAFHRVYFTKEQKERMTPEQRARAEFFEEITRVLAQRAKRRAEEKAAKQKAPQRRYP